MKNVLTVAAIVLVFGATTSEASAPAVSLAQHKKLERQVKALRHRVSDLEFCVGYEFVRVAEDFGDGALIVTDEGDMLIALIREDQKRCTN